MSVAPSPISSGIGAPGTPTFGADPLVFGPITFYSIEGPEDLPIGAIEQKVVVIERIGGGRDVQRLGAQPKPVTWRGKLFQPTIDSQLALLQQMVVSGQEYALTWHSQQWYAVLKDFTPIYHHVNFGEYEVTAEITRAGNGALTISQAQSTDTQVSNLTQNAANQSAAINAADSGAAATALNSSVSTLQVAIQNAGPVSQLTGSALTTLLTQITTTQGLATAYLATQANGSAQWIMAQQLVTSLQLLYANTSQGQTTTTQRVQGSSMFELCSTAYGDPTQAFALASANGLDSPFTSSQKGTVVSYPPIGVTPFTWLNTGSKAGVTSYSAGTGSAVVK